MSNLANQISGTAFTINKGGGSRGMSVENFVKSMVPQNDIEYTPYTQPKDILQTGVDESETYYNAVQSLNNFGTAMRSKNIDVLNPDSSNPDSVQAARTFEMLRRNVQQQGNALRAGHDLAKFFTKERLKKGNFANQPLIDEQGFSDATSTADLQKLTSIQPVAKEVQALVDSAALISDRKIGTAVELQDANIEIDKKRKALSGMVDQLAQAYNVPREVAQEMVSRGVASMSDAIGNDLLDKEFGLDERKADREDKLNKSKIFKNNADGKAAARKGKAAEQNAEDLLRRMISLNEGDGFDDRFDSKKSTFLRDMMISKGDQSGTGGKSGADDKIISGVFHKDGRAFAVVIPRKKLGGDADVANDQFDVEEILSRRTHKDVDVLPLDTDLIRSLYNNNKLTDEFDDFISIARDQNKLNDEGLLNFSQTQKAPKKRGGIKVNK